MSGDIMMANGYILVGSNAFFSEIKGFKSKDKDYVLLVDKPDGFVNVRYTHITNCLFEWRRMTAQEFVDYALVSKGPAMQIQKFLVPEFVKEIGFTIPLLKKLEPLISNLDDKHKYLKVIYDAYILNNDFTMTEEQLNSAYTAYIKERE